MIPPAVKVRYYNMHVREMTRLECEAMLSANRIGHLGCIAEGKPYVIPVRYIFEDSVFYSFSLPGKKVEALRSNPQICIQIDQLRTDEEWQSVLVEGRYQELPDDDNWHGQHMRAWSLLKQQSNWWEPGAYKPGASALPDTALLPVFYTILIENVSGRQATPTPSE